MKKNFKYILFFILTVFISTTSGYAAHKYLANEIEFTPSNKNWNVSNVSDAINYLYEKRNSSTIIDYITNGIPVNKGLIPKLESNKGSNGEAISNSPIYKSYDAWYAFNFDLTGDDKQNWASYVTTGNYGYIGYKFNEPQDVNVFYLNTLKNDNYTGACMNKFILQASNDGENWINLTDEIQHPVKTIKYYPVTKNEGNYYYYRLYGSSDGAGSLITIHELQFYKI